MNDDRRCRSWLRSDRPLCGAGHRVGHGRRSTARPATRSSREPAAISLQATESSSTAATPRDGRSDDGVRRPGAAQRRGPARVAQRREAWAHPSRERGGCATRGSSGGSCADDGSLRSAAKQGELLPQRQVLEREVRAGSERGTQRAQQSEYEGRCLPGSHAAGPSSSPCDRILANDSVKIQTIDRAEQRVPGRNIRGKDRPCALTKKAAPCRQRAAPLGRSRPG